MTFSPSCCFSHTITDSLLLIIIIIMSVTLSTVKISRDGGNHFVYPPALGTASNPEAYEIWELGGKVYIQWASSAPNWSISLYRTDLRESNFAVSITSSISDCSGEFQTLTLI